MTLFVYIVLALVVVAALVALAVLVLPANEELAPAAADRTPWALPAERAMTGPDVTRLRLPVTLRGYRFAETDAVLDRLGEEIAHRDSVIATLRAELEGRGSLADPSGEVLADAVVLHQERDDDLVELGETPEETEAEVVVVSEVDDDAVRVEVVQAPEVVEAAEPVEPVEPVEPLEVVEVVEPEPGPQVVGLDDELPELDDDGYAARPSDGTAERPPRS
ncbi:hypothetical protein ACXR2U_05805 [Jatrophihabitans sp. YIM 134969]